VSCEIAITKGVKPPRPKWICVLTQIRILDFAIVNSVGQTEGEPLRPTEMVRVRRVIIP